MSYKGNPKNRAKRKDDISDIMPSFKHDSEANIGEFFYSREALKLSYKKDIGTFVRYEENPVTPPALPYKVFTALLTQSGGDDVLTIGSDDIQPLQIGVTYTITLNDGTANFTNVGAPNNEIGTSFVATGTTPNSWGTPGDNQVSYNSGAPVVTVLENTIGNVWFTYDVVGSYYANSNGLFIESKTWMNTVIVLGVGGGAYRGTIYFNTQNLVSINTESDVDTASDDILYFTPIEIRVYE